MTLRRRARASCVVQSQAEACGRGLDEAQLRMLKAQVRIDESTHHTQHALVP